MLNEMIGSIGRDSASDFAAGVSLASASSLSGSTQNRIGDFLKIKDAADDDSEWSQCKEIVVRADDLINTLNMRGNELVQEGCDPFNIPAIYSKKMAWLSKHQHAYLKLLRDIDAHDDPEMSELFSVEILSVGANEKNSKRYWSFSSKDIEKISNRSADRTRYLDLHMYHSLLGALFYTRSIAADWMDTEGLQKRFFSCSLDLQAMRYLNQTFKLKIPSKALLDPETAIKFVQEECVRDEKDLFYHVYFNAHFTDGRYRAGDEGIQGTVGLLWMEVIHRLYATDADKLLSNIDTLAIGLKAAGTYLPEIGIGFALPIWKKLPALAEKMGVRADIFKLSEAISEWLVEGGTSVVAPYAASRLLAGDKNFVTDLVRSIPALQDIAEIESVLSAPEKPEAIYDAAGVQDRPDLAALRDILDDENLVDILACYVDAMHTPFRVTDEDKENASAMILARFGDELADRYNALFAIVEFQNAGGLVTRDQFSEFADRFLDSNAAETFHPFVVGYKEAREAITSLEEDVSRAMSEQQYDKLPALSETLQQNKAVVEEFPEKFISSLLPTPERITAVKAYLDPLLQEILSEKEEEELSDLFISENAELKEKNAELEQQVADLKTQLEHTSGNLNASLIAQNSKGVVVEGISDAEIVVKLMRDEGLTLVDTLKIVAQSYPKNVVVLPSAFEAAEESPFQYPKRALDALMRLSNEYINGIRNGLPSKKSAEQAGLYGMYRANESKTTASNERLRKQRTFLLDGEQVYMEEHLSIGKKVDTKETCQVHFIVRNNKVYIGRLGEHLDTISSS